jgi:DNA-binding transcriptional ArsR family regulator
MDTVDAATPFQRYVLLAVLAHQRRGETPVQSYDVRDFCVDHLAELDGSPFEGGVSRESVIRALSVLEEEGVLESEVVDASPVGKGRPAYRLATDEESVGESLAGDEILGSLATSLD